MQTVCVFIPRNSLESDFQIGALSATFTLSMLKDHTHTYKSIVLNLKKG